MNKCDVIIPIYNAYDMLAPCINSVLKNTDFSVAHLILIDDKSPDDRVVPLLKKIANNNRDKITLILNEENHGFVKTANIGMKKSKNDVLLLNSDTEVSEGWLDRIMECASSDERIATVTPLSNNAMLASVPVYNKENNLPEGYDLKRMTKIVAECSMHIYPEIPSGHGFCLYIKRSAIDKVGFFDEESFGKGYGEENDFCFRCLRFGYRHILCDDAFVQHKGAQSFGQKGDHVDELGKKYPRIMKDVGWWYAKRDTKIIGDNIALKVSTVENRINILLHTTKEKDKKIKTIINELRGKYNIHVLTDINGHYEMESFFKEYDIKTAIFNKPITMHEDIKDSKEYEEMLMNIKDIYGITVECDKNEKTKEIVEERCKIDGKPKRINYERARNKLVEYAFLYALKMGKEVAGAQAVMAEEERKLAAEKEWRENLTIAQRVGLKIRYILLGR